MGSYPTAYRRGAQNHSAAGLSTTAGGSPLDRAIAQTNATRLLEEVLKGGYRRQVTPGTSRVPRSALGKVGRLSGGHPAIALALRALAIAQNALEEAPTEYDHSPGMVRGGSCPMVDTLTGPIYEALPSTTCATGQAVDPDFNYTFHCGLGVGHWRKRASAANYNQLSWWMPAGNCAAVRAQGGPFDTDGVKQGDPSPELKTAPALDPMAQTVGQQTPQAHSMPWEVIVAIREERFTLLERSERGDVQTLTQTETVLLPVAPPPKRPEKGKRERKITVSRTIIRLLGAITERLDNIKAVYPCLPKAVRAASEASHHRKDIPLEDIRGTDKFRKMSRKQKRAWYNMRRRMIKDAPKNRKFTPAHKAAVIFQHLGKLDPSCTVFNLLWDEIEDAAYAYVSRHSKLPGSGRSHQMSQQGDADLPHNQLDFLKWAKKTLQAELGIEKEGK